MDFSEGDFLRSPSGHTWVVDAVHGESVEIREVEPALPQTRTLSEYEFEIAAGWEKI